MSSPKSKVGAFWKGFWEGAGDGLTMVGKTAGRHAVAIGTLGLADTPQSFDNSSFIRRYGTLGKWSQGTADFGFVCLETAAGMKMAKIDMRAGLRTAHTKGPWSRVSYKGKDVLGADWSKFKLDGKMVNRPHYHQGATKSQFSKHRPWQGW